MASAPPRASTQAADGATNAITIAWDGLDTQNGGQDLKAYLGTVTHDDLDPETVLPLEITVIEVGP